MLKLNDYGLNLSMLFKDGCSIPDNSDLACVIECAKERIEDKRREINAIEETINMLYSDLYTRANKRVEYTDNCTGEIKEAYTFETISDNEYNNQWVLTSRRTAELIIDTILRLINEMLTITK